MVNRMRSTHAHTANRRSHHALAGVRLSSSKEGAVHPRHRALLDGSRYRGKSILDVGAKRLARKQKAEKRARQESGTRQEKQPQDEAKNSKEITNPPSGFVLVY